MRPVYEALASFYEQNEVNEIEARLDANLGRWNRELAPYRRAAGADFTYIFMPILVFKAFQFLGAERWYAVAMATIFKTAYLGNTINLTVRDSEEGQDHNMDLQFSILIADYIFGRNLKALVECDSSWLLDDFSAMMAEINEGFVLQFKYDADYCTILEKTRVPLYVTAFTIAGRRAGLDEETTEKYARIGRYLGMSLELYASGDSRSRDFLLKADALLEEMNIRHRNIEHDLCRLVDLLAEAYHQGERIAAV